MTGTHEVRTRDDQPIKEQGKRKEVRVIDEEARSFQEQLLEQVKITNYLLAQVLGEEFEEPESLKE